jgi:sugar phosphate isomerase/epimerase
MVHGVSTYLFVGERITPALLDRIARTGIVLAELFCARSSFDYRSRAQAAEIARYFRDSPLQLHSLHSPIYRSGEWESRSPQDLVNIADPERIRRREGVDEIKRALEVAELARFKYLIQHIGATGEAFDPRKMDAAVASLEELNAFARDRGVEILLENILNRLSTPEQLVGFVERTGLPNGFCFDTGHAHLESGVEAAFEMMKERTRSTHVHGNDGAADQHLLPPGGALDWKHTMELLRSRAHQYPLLIEPERPPGGQDPLEALRRSLDQLEEQ